MVPPATDGRLMGIVGWLPQATGFQRLRVTTRGIGQAVSRPRPVADVTRGYGVDGDDALGLLIVVDGEGGSDRLLGLSG